VIGGDFAIASLFPEITSQSPNTSVIADTAQVFFAELLDLEEIESVWAVVVPPDYVAPATSKDLEAPEVGLPVFDLGDADGDGRYEATYSDFTYSGDYRITFYARNDNGNVTVSPAMIVTVSGGLPLVTDIVGRVTDTVGNGIADVLVGTEQATTYTSENGYFVLTVASGTHDLRLSKSGFAAMIVTVEALSGSHIDLEDSTLEARGDVDGDGECDLRDAILSISQLVERDVNSLIRSDYPTSGVDLDGDDRIGLAEAIYIMQRVSGLR